MYLFVRVALGYKLAPVNTPNALSRRVRGGGFTAMELLVALGMLVILLSIFVPYLMKVREVDRRVRCADHLKQIRNALQAYAADNGRRFPRVRYDAAENPNGFAAWTGPDDADPFSPASAVSANDVTASLWLLVRRGLLDNPAVFICPSSSDMPDALSDSHGRAVRPLGRGNFRNPFNLSYGYSSPFSAAVGYSVNADQAADFAIMADKGRVRVNEQHHNLLAGATAATPEQAAGNSANHNQAGQNVLYASGAVVFQTTPYCGVRHDNIYTALWRSPLEPGHSPPAEGQGYWGPDIGPSWPQDSYLMPLESRGR